MGGRCGEGGVVSSIVVGNGARSHEGNIGSALEQSAGLGHIAQLVGIVGVFIVLVGNLLELRVYLFGLFTQLVSLDIGLGCFSQQVTFHIGMGNICDNQHATGVEVSVNSGELHLFEGLSFNLNGRNGDGFLLVHHLEGSLINTQRDVGERVIVGSHVGFGQLGPGGRLGSLLGILSGGEGLLYILLHFCSGFLGKCNLQGAGHCKNEN